MAEDSTNRLETVSKTVQVVSVVIGVVISVLSFNYAQQKDAEARQKESETKKFELEKYYNERNDQANKQKIEAAKPFLELRQQRYMETIQAVAVLTTPDEHSADELKKARKRFWELYWAELAMVEDKGVEGLMVRFGETLQTDADLSARKQAAYNLSHALRDSLVKSWGITENEIGKTNP